MCAAQVHVTLLSRKLIVQLDVQVPVKSNNGACLDSHHAVFTVAMRLDLSHIGGMGDRSDI